MRADPAQDPLEAARSPDGSVSLGFALVGALATFGGMQLAGTPRLDRLAFHAGVALAAVAGAAVAWGVQRLGRYARWSGLRWALVIAAFVAAGAILSAPARVFTLVVAR